MALKGYCQTVCGVLSPEDLGFVLPHEHLLLHFDKALQKPPLPYHEDELYDLDFSIENLGLIRQLPYCVKDNLFVDDENVLVNELELYKKAGGMTLVDVTTNGIRHNPAALPRLSQKSGVNIVFGTGFYVDACLTEEVKSMDTRARSEYMVRELTQGVEGCEFKAGVIGEMGCSWPLTPHERVSLQAAALAQKQTGAPLIIHPGRDHRSPVEILDVLSAEGADLEHTVMSHIDRSIYKESELLELARRGCLLEWDLFGTECSHYQFADVDMPSDAQRIGWIKFLVDQGFEKQVVISHDVHTKHRLTRYGGHGYAHILRNVIPKMRARGIPDEVIDTITRDNPQKWLQFK